MLEKADALVLNHIIERIYLEEDVDCLRLWILETIRPILPFSAACFYLADNSNAHLLKDGLGVGFGAGELQDYIDDFEEKDYTRWLFMCGRNMVFRESDYFPDSVRQSEEYYKYFYAPRKLYWCSQGNITSDGNFLGVIVFYRTEEEGDFSERDLFIIELLLPHLSKRLQRELEEHDRQGTAARPNFVVQRLVEPHGLTSREAEVLEYLVAGLDSAQICETLSISINTFKKHSANIYSKLGIGHRWELIKYC